ncbi:trafficking protein particle complex subunit 1 [Planococcus citri]|uniref:trafficking protein particle complex subunit 1 n=1 Tax=Planococcus citri TaxID=170843 RepID=UPI0031F94726
MIYNLYIFDKGGKLLFYSEWNRQKQSGISKDEEAKLMYGMLFSIKNFVTKISPSDLKQGFLCYKTNKYALHFLETPTGLKFVLNTDVNAQKVRDVLQQLYSNVYVNYVVRNPICNLQDPIKSELFKTKLDSYIKQTSIYTTK